MSQAVEYKFDPEPRDFDIIRCLRTHMKLNGLTEFSADDMRGLHLEQFLGDTLHGMGSWCARMQHNKFIEPVGRKRSSRPERHLAFIKTYRLTGKDLKT